MYQGKHTTSNNNVVSKRRTALILSIVLILTCAVGGSLAYFTDFDFSISSLRIGEVTCTAMVNTDGSITVTNTGDSSAYVRVRVTANNVKDNGAVVYGTQPTVTLGETDAWEYKDDGYFYHKGLVEKNTSVTLPLSYGVQSGTKLTILASAEAILQTSAWENTPSGT